MNASQSAPQLRGENIIAVASGKGGVGKTWFSITLAHLFARAGRKTLLFDGDIGLANVDVQLGLTPETPFPSSRAPHVCDMSSDFLGRRLDMSRFALVYAGAQKNLGPSGVVVVVADNELMAGARDDVADIFRFAVHAKHGSLFNTPPTLAIYLVRNVLLWLEGQGGIEAIERQNEEKARLVYAEIDRAPDFYRCPVELGSRSLMNVVFRLPTAELEARFVADAAAGGMVGLKGHRSVGGVRASLYNAVPVAAAQSLASFMREFHRTCVA